MTTTTDRQDLGSRLRQLRVDRGYTQEDLAKALSVDKSAVSRIENGERGLATAELALASAEFGVSADHLLFGAREDEVLLRADGEAGEAVEFARSVFEDLEFVEALVE